MLWLLVIELLAGYSCFTFFNLSLKFHVNNLCLFASFIHHTLAKTHCNYILYFSIISISRNIGDRCISTTKKDKCTTSCFFLLTDRIAERMSSLYLVTDLDEWYLSNANNSKFLPKKLFWSRKFLQLFIYYYILKIYNFYHFPVNKTKNCCM